MIAKSKLNSVWWNRVGVQLRPWQPAKTLDELCAGGSSGYGWSHAGLMSKCMEAYRLAEVQRLEAPRWEDPEGLKLHALPLGILWHWMLEAHYSQVNPIPHLKRVKGVPLGEVDRLETMYLLYAKKYVKEPFEILATECRIAAPVVGVAAFIDGKLDMQRDQPYSVRYDTIIRYANGAIYSLEHKTASEIRGTTSAEWYCNSSIHGQVWTWNNHPVSRLLGPMKGVMMNLITKKPDAELERMPLYIAKPQLAMHERNLKYWFWWRNDLLRDVGPDEVWPQNNMSCWSRYGPCEFLATCHNGVSGHLHHKPRPVGATPPDQLEAKLRESITSVKKSA